MSTLRPNEIEALRRDASHAAPARGEAGPATGIIESARTCATCGYALRGLPIGGDCPECGASTRIPEDIDHPLSLMPLPTIRRLKWGCWAAFWGMGAAVVLIVTHTWRIFPPLLTLGALAAVALSWQVAVRLATPALDLPQAALRGFSRHGRLRIAVQWLQLGWMAAAVAALLGAIIGGGAAGKEPLVTIIRGGTAVGVAGLMLLALLLERLAEWARESSGEKCFNWILWTLPLAIIILIWEPPATRLGIFLYAGAIVTMLLYPFAMLILARSVGLSVHHAIEYELRRERQQERRERFFAKVIQPHVADRGPGGAAAAMPQEISLAEPVRKKKDGE